MIIIIITIIIIIIIINNNINIIILTISGFLDLFTPFQLSVAFLYPLKTSENLQVFFQSLFDHF